MNARLRAFLTLSLIGLALVACAEDAPPTATPQPTATPRATSGAQTLKVGERAPLPDGQSIAVLAVEYPVPNPKYSREPVLAADVEWCAGPRPAGGTVQTDSFRFGLIMPDNTRQGVNLGEKDPPMVRSTLAPGDCVRGWVTFSPPVMPTAITYQAQDPATGRPVLIKWELSR